MTAKEYLQQLQTLEAKVKHEADMRDELRDKAYGLKAVSYDRDHVQSSGRGNTEDLIIKIVDMERASNGRLERYMDLKRDIVDKICKLDNRQYIEVLYKRYVEHKRLEMIAVEMDYSYDRVRHLHGYALKSFGQLLKHDTK